MTDLHDPHLPELLREMADGHPDRATDTDVVGMLETMVLHPEYPCLGAKSVFRRDRADVLVLDGLGTAEAGQRLHDALVAFAARTDLAGGFASFVAVFRDEGVLTEEQFEMLLWEQLREVHRVDDEEWDVRVSADPSSPHFAFSAGGTAFFVVGMHPGASRIARRTPLPTLVFNLHEQFEQLRASEHFGRMRDAIRMRDVQLQGVLNPMVDDHGAGSEARQYAGREVPDDWAPPRRPGAQDVTA